MRNIRLPLALLISVPGLLAFQPKPTLNCNNNDHGNGRGGRFCEIREQTISAGGVLNVDASQNGGISIKGWDRADVLVRSQVQTQAASDDQARDMARQVMVQANAGSVRSTGPKNERDQSWSVSYEIFMPVRSSVTLNTVNGGLSISDVTGNLEFKTVNGGLHLARVGGYVHGETMNGGVSVELSGDHWDGQGLDVKTTNGGVKVKVPQNYSAQFEASTSNGGFHAADMPELEAALRGVDGRRTNRVATTIGRGGPMVKVATVNGGVSLGR